MDPLRILVADDHDIVRQGVRALLHQQSGWNVTWEAATGREAVEIAKRERPDVSILDLGMPEMNGLEATRQILRDQPMAQVLIFTMHDSEQLIRQVFDSGARGYVLKSETGKDLVPAVQALRQHRVFFASKVASVVLADYLKVRRELHNREPAGSTLTPREREITQLLAEGKSNKEVAGVLNIEFEAGHVRRHWVEPDESLATAQLYNDLRSSSSESTLGCICRFDRDRTRSAVVEEET